MDEPGNNHFSAFFSLLSTAHCRNTTTSVSIGQEATNNFILLFYYVEILSFLICFLKSSKKIHPIWQIKVIMELAMLWLAHDHMLASLKGSFGSRVSCECSLLVSHQGTLDRYQSGLPVSHSLISHTIILAYGLESINLIYKFLWGKIHRFWLQDIMVELMMSPRAHFILPEDAWRKFTKEWELSILKSMQPV